MAAILRGGGDQVLTVNLRGPPNSRAPFTGFYCIVEKHLLTRQIVRDMNILYTMAAIVMAGNFIVKRVKSILIVKRTCKNMSKSSIKVWNSNVTIVVNISLNNQIGQDTWKWCTKKKLNWAKYEQPQNCHICGKMISTKSNFIRHMKTIHKGIKPMIEHEFCICEFCGKGFNQSSNFTRHLRLDHKNEANIELYKCVKCNKFFKSIASRKQHYTLSHNNWIIF